MSVLSLDVCHLLRSRLVLEVLSVRLHVTGGVNADERSSWRRFHCRLRAVERFPLESRNAFVKVTLKPQLSFLLSFVQNYALIRC